MPVISRKEGFITNNNIPLCKPKYTGDKSCNSTYKAPNTPTGLSVTVVKGPSNGATINYRKILKVSYTPLQPNERGGMEFVQYHIYDGVSNNAITAGSSDNNPFIIDLENLGSSPTSIYMNATTTYDDGAERVVQTSDPTPTIPVTYKSMAYVEPPQDVKAEATYDSVKIRWDASDANRFVKFNSMAGSWVTATVKSIPAGYIGTLYGPSAYQSITFNNDGSLQRGIPYTFTVTFSDDYETGSPSPPSNPVTLQAAPATAAAAPVTAVAASVTAAAVVVPGAPTIQTATALNTTATVTWNLPSTGGAGITGYTVTSNPGEITASVRARETSATLTGLTPGTSYTFTVTATNSAGTGPASTASNRVIATGTDAGIPVTTAATATTTTTRAPTTAATATTTPTTAATATTTPTTASTTAATATTTTTPTTAATTTTTTQATPTTSTKLLTSTSGGVTGIGSNNNIQGSADLYVQNVNTDPSKGSDGLPGMYSVTQAPEQILYDNTRIPGQQIPTKSLSSPTKTSTTTYIIYIILFIVVAIIIYTQSNMLETIVKAANAANPANVLPHKIINMRTS